MVGKSTAVRVLKDMGAYVVDMDLIARQIVEPGMNVEHFVRHQ